MSQKPSLWSCTTMQKEVLSTEMVKCAWRGVLRWKDKEFNLDLVELQAAVACPRGRVRQAFGDAGLDFRGEFVSGEVELKGLWHRGDIES